MERLPPQSIEAEQSVLGSVLIEREAVARAIDMLRPEDFYREAHRQIFQTVIDLFEQGKPVDLVTVSEALRDRGQLELVGGLPYLTELTMAVPTAANVEYYAQIVRERALRRGIILAATEIARRGYDGGKDADTLLDEAEQLIFALGERRQTRDVQEFGQVLVAAYRRIEELYSSQSRVTGVPSGFDQLDELTAGFQPSDLIIIAARPSMGKTMFCLNIARNVALNENIPVAIFSLEMSAEQLALRMLCAEASVNAQQVRRGRLTEPEWERLVAAVTRLGRTKVFIDDTPGQSVLGIRSRCRRLKNRYGLGLVIIDYLQLMEASSRLENRQQEISAISRSLKALARELNVPVIALSQLSRAVESRERKRPMLSDLRESGAIEQDADVVAFIYREAYYNPEEAPPGGEEIAEIIVAKQRNGPTGTVQLGFFKEYGLFRPIDWAHRAEPV